MTTTWQWIQSNNYFFWLGIAVIAIMLMWFFFGGRSDHKVQGLEYFNPVTFMPIELEDDTPVDVISVVNTPVLDEKYNVPDEPVIAQSDTSTVINGRMSKGEEICKRSIEKIYGRSFVKVRPQWLKNPETSRNLELDLYNEELKIAIEYNGIQHYVWPNFTGSTYQEFMNQTRRDMFKADVCAQRGVYLITVPYTVAHSKIEQYIIDNLPQN